MIVGSWKPLVRSVRCVRVFLRVDSHVWLKMSWMCGGLSVLQGSVLLPLVWPDLTEPRPPWTPWTRWRLDWPITRTGTHLNTSPSGGWGTRGDRTDSWWNGTEPVYDEPGVNRFMMIWYWSISWWSGIDPIRDELVLIRFMKKWYWTGGWSSGTELVRDELVHDELVLNQFVMNW